MSDYVIYLAKNYDKLFQLRFPGVLPNELESILLPFPHDVQSDLKRYKIPGWVSKDTKKTSGNLKYIWVAIVNINYCANYNMQEIIMYDTHSCAFPYGPYRLDQVINLNNFKILLMYL